MAMHTYSSLVSNTPPKIYQEHRQGYLEPYFKREKTIEEIAAETGRSATELRRWLRKDFSVIDAAIGHLEQVVSDLESAVEALETQLAAKSMTLEQLLERGDCYQRIAIDDIAIEKVAKDLGEDVDSVRLHMNALYNKVHHAFALKDAVLAQKDAVIEHFKNALLEKGGA